MGSKCIYTTIIIGQHLSFITQPNYNSVCCVLPNVSPATMPLTSNRGGRAGQTCPPRPLTITFPHSTGVVLLLLMRRISHTVICPYLFYRRGVTELCKYNWFFLFLFTMKNQRLLHLLNLSPPSSKWPSLDCRAARAWVRPDYRTHGLAGNDTSRWCWSAASPGSPSHDNVRLTADTINPWFVPLGYP